MLENFLGKIAEEKNVISLSLSLFFKIKRPILRRQISLFERKSALFKKKCPFWDDKLPFWEKSALFEIYCPFWDNKLPFCDNYPSISRMTIIYHTIYVYGEKSNPVIPPLTVNIWLPHLKSHLHIKFINWSILICYCGSVYCARGTVGCP